MATLGDVDTSKIDFYEFLGLTQGSTASLKEINRAGRQTSFRYHPDKVAATPENLENFHIAQIAIGILTDPEEKAKYDQQRDAKLRRKAEVDALDDRRRTMAEDLERREKNGISTNVVAGQKRTFSERDMKIRAAQEANRKKMEERNAAVRLEAEKKAAEERARATKADGVPSATNDQEQKNTSSGKDAESTGTSIRLRWFREGEGQGFDEAYIADLYPANDVDNVVLLKDKKRKIEGRGKIMVGTAVVMFNSAMKAKLAMAQKAALLDKFDTVEWLDTGSKDEWSRRYS